MKKSQTFLMKWIKMTRNTFYNSGAFDPGKRNVCLTFRRGGRIKLKLFHFNFIFSAPRTNCLTQCTPISRGFIRIVSSIVLQLSFSCICCCLCVCEKGTICDFIIPSKIGYIFPPKKLSTRNFHYSWLWIDHS